ncbi:CNNM domain-containing protein [Mycoplasmopsis opalescens]|uniref:CNNM domain-containing protein n=1 Tax=Mycoplasmopsis opalescens TaxID=114886 RepID=UPI0004A7437B|nr:CNNM domain-containing protein [Mycoplasmopsis opalescens]
MIYLYSALSALFIVLSAIFSACETAYTSLNPGKIEKMIENNEFGSKIIKKQYSFFNQTLSTILICNNIVNIAASSTFSFILSSSLSEINKDYNVLISTAVMTPIIVLVSEITPKIIAKAKPVQTAKAFCIILLAMYYILFPITYPLGKIGKKIYVTNDEEEVKGLITVAQNEGVLEAEESMMAQNALALDSIKVRSHYVKMRDVTCLSANDNVAKALEVFNDTHYSRIPVKKDDQFIGIVIFKDIAFTQKGRVINFLKTVPNVSANSTLSSALKTMRRAQAQMAFVLENNSSVTPIGVITIEDIIEEIIGEIYDEYDQEEVEEIFEISLDHFIVSQHVQMRKLLKTTKIDWELDESEYEISLGEFLEKKMAKKLSRSLNYELEDVYFKASKTQKNYKKDLRIEIHIGNQAEIKQDETTIYNEG